MEAPAIAVAHLAGQFVILRPKSTSERIPLTIASSEPAAGTITLYVQTVGHTTHVLNSLEEGDGIADVVGPLVSESPPRSPRGTHPHGSP